MLARSTYLVTNEGKYSEGKDKKITKIKILYNKGEKAYISFFWKVWSNSRTHRSVEKRHRDSWMSLPIEQTLKY